MSDQAPAPILAAEALAAMNEKLLASENMSELARIGLSLLASHRALSAEVARLNDHADDIEGRNEDEEANAAALSEELFKTAALLDMDRNTDEALDEALMVDGDDSSADDLNRHAFKVAPMGAEIRRRVAGLKAEVARLADAERVAWCMERGFRFLAEVKDLDPHSDSAEDLSRSWSPFIVLLEATDIDGFGWVIQLKKKNRVEDLPQLLMDSESRAEISAHPAWATRVTASTVAAARKEARHA